MIENKQLLPIPHSECLKVAVRVRPPAESEMGKEEVVYVNPDVSFTDFYQIIG